MNSVLIFLLIFIFQLFCYHSVLADTLKATPIKKSFNNANVIKKILLEQGYKEIPLRLSIDKNYLLIDASLNDERITEPFILDTGSMESSIDQHIQNKFQFKKTGKSITSGGGGGSYFRTYQVVIPTVQIRSVKAINQSMIVQHYSHIKVDQKNISGMIGLEFLRQHHAIIDFHNHRMFLKMNNNSKKQTIENFLNQMPYQVIKLMRSSSGHQILPVKINDKKPVTFMLDSGVPPFIMLDYQYAKRIMLPVEGKPMIGKGSSNAIMKIYNTKVNKLSIGPIISGPQPAIITTGLEFAKIGIPVFGIIGLNWMRSHDAILDTHNDLLFVKPT